MAQSHDVEETLSGLPEDVLADVAATFKVLSDPTREQLVYLLTQKAYSVNELSEQVALSGSAAFLVVWTNPFRHY